MILYESGTIFYISSPFSEESDLRILLNKIVDSLKRKNRKLYVIYYYPYFRTLFDEYNDYFKLIKEINIIGQVLIYEHELI